MGVVDVVYEVYRCPHCEGFLLVREQFPFMEIGCSISLEHVVKLPDYLKDEPVLEVEKKC